MANTTLRNLTIVGASALLLSTTGCGYSESEWQAQLAKYDALAQKNQTTEAELAEVQARVEKLRQELEAVGFKLGEEGAARAALQEVLDEYRQRAEALERIKERFEKLREKLEALTKLGLEVEIRNNRMVISLPGDVLFASGKDSLEDKGIEILGKVAEVILSDSDLAKRTYQVAGHTDDQKLTSARATRAFKDNWGLSLMRARTVLLFLVSPNDAEDEPGGGLDRNLWSASGYGDTDPVVGNEDKAGRQKNRRVELIMMPNVEEMLDLQSLTSESSAAEKPAPAEPETKESKPEPAENTKASGATPPAALPAKQAG